MLLAHRTTGPPRDRSVEGAPYPGQDSGPSLPHPIVLPDRQQVEPANPRDRNRTRITEGGGPFVGMAYGEVLTNPVVTPDPGVERLSMIERGADAGTLRVADVEAAAVYSNAAPRPEVFDLEPPPHLRPPGIPDRGQRHPVTSTNQRQWPRFNDHETWGKHAEFNPVVQTNPGNMNPVTHSRTMHRLAPEPWETAITINPGG